MEARRLRYESTILAHTPIADRVGVIDNVVRVGFPVGGVLLIEATKGKHIGSLKPVMHNEPSAGEVQVVRDERIFRLCPEDDIEEIYVEFFEGVVGLDGKTTRSL